MRRPVGVKGIGFGICWPRCFSLPSRHCRHPSIRALDERSCRSVQVGRSRFSRCCHLIIDLGSISKMKDGQALICCGEWLPRSPLVRTFRGLYLIVSGQREEDLRGNRRPHYPGNRGALAGPTGDHQAQLPVLPHLALHYLLAQFMDEIFGGQWGEPFPRRTRQKYPAARA
jgi:hypothetical protein